MKIKDYYNKVMQEHRCSQCNRLLFKSKMHGDYRVEIKCPKCKNINVFDRRIVNLTKDK